MPGFQQSHLRLPVPVQTLILTLGQERKKGQEGLKVRDGKWWARWEQDMKQILLGLQHAQVSSVHMAENTGARVALHLAG